MNKKELIRTFFQQGITLLGKTPEINNDRSTEIKEWLKKHPEVDSFVIFDDIKFGWYELAPFVVNTDYRIGRGLEKRHIEKAIKILLKAE